LPHHRHSQAKADTERKNVVLHAADAKTALNKDNHINTDEAVDHNNRGSSLAWASFTFVNVVTCAATVELILWSGECHSFDFGLFVLVRPLVAFGRVLLIQVARVILKLLRMLPVVVLLVFSCVVPLSFSFAISQEPEFLQPGPFSGCNIKSSLPDKAQYQRACDAEDARKQFFG
jgi:hypothetical protein